MARPESYRTLYRTIGMPGLPGPPCGAAAGLGGAGSGRTRRSPALQRHPGAGRGARADPRQPRDRNITVRATGSRVSDDHSDVQDRVVPLNAPALEGSLGLGGTVFPTRLSCMPPWPGSGLSGLSSSARRLPLASPRRPTDSLFRAG